MGQGKPTWIVNFPGRESKKPEGETGPSNNVFAAPKENVQITQPNPVKAIADQAEEPDIDGHPTPYGDITKVIEESESQAWRICNSSLNGLVLPETPNWFDDLLDTRIIPVLSRIGMDAPCGRALIQIAMPAWKLIGAITDKTLFYEPAAMSELEEVEQGLLRKSENIDENHFWLSCIVYGIILCFLHSIPRRRHAG